ncbi:ATP-dependent Clp protease proteolytic subunit, partial [Pseudomonas monteilii]|nr:ATP-dependent Clp protease proteolytic subunit [Pseudomonas monteilii]
ERDTDRDNFMTAQEAKDYGLIDEIMESNKLKQACIKKGVRSNSYTFLRLLVRRQTSPYSPCW